MKICKHPLQKHGYIEWHAWAREQEAKGKKQKQCEICGLWFYPEEE